MSFTLVYDAPVIHRIHKTTCPVNASSPQVPPILPVFLRHSSPLTPKKPINTKVYRFFQQPLFSCLTPRVGLEPTTPRLTAVCSTIELSRMIRFPLLSYLLWKPTERTPMESSLLVLSFPAPSKLHTASQPYQTS